MRDEAIRARHGDLSYVFPAFRRLSLEHSIYYVIGWNIFD
jgi:hypothetical protein